MTFSPNIIYTMAMKVFRLQLILEKNLHYSVFFDTRDIFYDHIGIQKTGKINNLVTLFIIVYR